MRSSRILPKISGTLNNCALHACVPEIILAARYFAMEEVDKLNEANADLSKLEIFRKNYERLKQEFAQFYSIDINELTWRKFYNLLTISVNYNHFAAQIIMGPVLRKFMESNIATLNLSPFMKQETEIRNDGRYPLLHAKFLDQFVCSPLGIEITEYSKQDKSERIYQMEKYNNGSGVFVINIYNDDLHWERVPKDKIDSVVNDRDNLSADAKGIANAISEISESDSKSRTEKGLQKLQVAVRAKFSNLLLGNGNVVAPLTIPQQDFIATLKPQMKTHVRKLLNEFNKENGAFTVSEAKKIPATMDAINNAETDPAQESDEDFARRLQEAEIRLALQEADKSNMKMEESVPVMDTADEISSPLDYASPDETDESFAQRLGQQLNSVEENNKINAQVTNKTPQEFYAEHRSNILKLAQTGFFHINAKHKIQPTAAAIHNAEKLPGESDDSFAIRLQAAQLEYDKSQSAHDDLKINQLN